MPFVYNVFSNFVMQRSECFSSMTPSGLHELFVALTDVGNNNKKTASQIAILMGGTCALFSEP